MLMSLGDDLLFLIFEFAIISIESCKDYRTVCQRCKIILTGNHCHAKLRDVWAKDFVMSSLRFDFVLDIMIPRYITTCNANILCIHSNKNLFPYAQNLARSSCVTRLSYQRVYSLGHSDPYRLFIGLNKNLNKKRIRLWFKYQIQNGLSPALLLHKLPSSPMLSKIRDLVEVCSSLYVFGKPLPIIFLWKGVPDVSFDQFFTSRNLTVDYEMLHFSRDLHRGAFLEHTGDYW